MTPTRGAGPLSLDIMDADPQLVSLPCKMDGVSRYGQANQSIAIDRAVGAVCWRSAEAAARPLILFLARRGTV